MVWIRDSRPERLKRWLPAEVASRTFQGWEGWMYVIVRVERSMLVVEEVVVELVPCMLDE